GFDKGRMLGYVCGISGVQGDAIGRMLIKDVYSFIDIEPERFELVFNSFKGASYKGRKIRVDEAQGAQGRPPGPTGPGARQGSVRREQGKGQLAHGSHPHGRSRYGGSGQRGGESGGKGPSAPKPKRPGKG
ncbi:MAG: DbpA RNA binding domain-containing protein, partial [Flavobacteriales bacterium]